MISRPDIQDIIDGAPVSAMQRRILWLCFLVVAIDGFDTAVIGFLAPEIRAEWGASAAALTPLMMAGLIGLMVGSFAFGPLSDRVGRRPVLIATTALFGLMCLLSGLSTSLEMLIALRFLTGLGLGGAMPNAITLSNEFSPAARRSSLVTLMFCGFTVGMAAAGFIAAAIIPSMGWRAVLIVGGVIPLGLIPVLMRGLPESPRFLAIKGKQSAAIAKILVNIAPERIGPATEFAAAPQAASAPARQLFSASLLIGTLLLWATFFMGLLVIFLVGNWLPLILTDAGVEATTAKLVTTGFHLGGAVGAIVIGRLMDRYRPTRVLALGYIIAALSVAAVSLVGGVIVLTAAAVFAAGFCMSGGQVGLNAFASSFYPTSARATGVAWANGVGRSGSILGSVIGGALVAQSWQADAIFFLLAIPALIAAMAIASVGSAAQQEDAEAKAATA